MPPTSSSAKPAPISFWCSKRVRLLVTRPEPDAERSAAALRRLGHAVLVAPLMRIETVERADLASDQRFAAVVMTSANAARAIAHHPRHAALTALPVFAVGRQTAEAARSAGFAEIVSADGNADDLSRLIGARFPRGAALLYLAGEDRAADLAGDLALRGIEVQTAVVYRAVAVGAFPAVVEHALQRGALDGVLHFSRRSVATYLRCAQAADLREEAVALMQCCLSSKVAEPLVAAGAKNIQIAPQPTEAALLGLIAGV
jgi:uroporphyrinogen-III synthase